MILLMVQKSGKLTSWYGKYPILYDGFYASKRWSAVSWQPLMSGWTAMRTWLLPWISLGATAWPRSSMTWLMSLFFFASDVLFNLYFSIFVVRNKYVHIVLLLFLYANIYSIIYIYTLSQWKFPMHLLKLTKIPEDPSDIDMMQDGATSIQLTHMSRIAWFRPSEALVRRQKQRGQATDDVGLAWISPTKFQRSGHSKDVLPLPSSGRHLSLKNMAKHA